MTDADRSSRRSSRRREVLALLAAFGVAEDALAQDARTADPRSFRVVLENDRVRVLEYRSRPGLSVCGQGMHYHPARVMISLTAAKYRVTLPDGRTSVRDVEAGEVLYAEPVTHSTELLGGTGSRSCIVELKSPDWRPSSG